MDLYDAILGRRSVRSYLPRELDKASIEKMLEAARWAPTAGNVQPWKFIVVRNPIMLDLIHKVSPGMLEKPPMIIVVCSDKNIACKFGEAREYDYLGPVDCALAVENIVLVAYSLGIATCIVRSFIASALSEFLDLPSHIRPELLITAGYARDVPKPPQKLLLKEIAYNEKLTSSW
jgi:nitroreductase